MQDDNDFGVEPEVTTRKRWKDMTADERREVDAERQRNKRKRIAEEKEAKAASDASQTCEQFWQAQRNLVSRETLAPLLARQEIVFDTLHWMKAQIDGTYDVDPNDSTVFVGLAEGIADLEADVREHGTCLMEITLLGEFWKSPELLPVLMARNDATGTFARYGIVTAIPEHRYHEFQQFLTKQEKPQ
jgi:hypothetical protein